MVDLQCCVSFRGTANWFSYTYTCIYSFQILFPYRSLQSIEQSSLCYTVGPCGLPILYIVVCIRQSQPKFELPLTSHSANLVTKVQGIHLCDPECVPFSLSAHCTSSCAREGLVGHKWPQQGPQLEAQGPAKAQAEGGPYKDLAEGTPAPAQRGNVHPPGILRTQESGCPSFPPLHPATGAGQPVWPKVKLPVPGWEWRGTFILCVPFPNILKKSAQVWLVKRAGHSKHHWAMQASRLDLWSH